MERAGAAAAHRCSHVLLLRLLLLRAGRAALRDDEHERHVQEVGCGRVERAVGGGVRELVTEPEVLLRIAAVRCSVLGCSLGWGSSCPPLFICMQICLRKVGGSAG